MKFKFWLAGIFSLSLVSTQDSRLSGTDNIGKYPFVFKLQKNNANPFWKINPEKKQFTDTASLKQSNWYAEAMKGIEESEYEIKYDEAIKSYSSPNRKNNLRSFYTANTFTLQPRNDSADKWKLGLTLMGVYSGNQKI